MWNDTEITVTAIGLLNTEALSEVWHFFKWKGVNWSHLHEDTAAHVSTMEQYDTGHKHVLNYLGIVHWNTVYNMELLWVEGPGFVKNAIVCTVLLSGNMAVMYPFHRKTRTRLPYIKLYMIWKRFHTFINLVRVVFLGVCALLKPGRSSERH